MKSPQTKPAQKPAPRISRLTTLVFIFAVVSTVSAADQSDWDIARAVMMDSSTSAEKLIKWSDHTHPAVRKAALVRMRELGDQVFEPAIAARLSDSIWSVRRTACFALETCGSEASRTLVERLTMSDRNLEVRQRGIMFLGELGDSRSLPTLRQLAAHENFAVRGQAAEKIGKCGGTAEDIPLLFDLARTDGTKYVRWRAGLALRNLGVEPPPEVPPSLWKSSKFRSFLLKILLCTISFIAIAVLLVKQRRYRTCMIFVIVCISVILYQTSRPPIRYAENGYILRWDRDLIESKIVRSNQSPDLFLRRLAEGVRSYDELKDITVEENQLDFEMSYFPERDQYNGSRILRIIQDDLKERAVVTVTYKDLFQEPWYQTQGNGTDDAAIVSFRRIDPVFLGEGDGTDSDREIFHERALKLTVHELGHLLGLGHCKSHGCIMEKITLPEHYYRMSYEFCDLCESQIRANSVGGWRRPP